MNPVWVGQAAVHNTLPLPGCLFTHLALLCSPSPPPPPPPFQAAKLAEKEAKKAKAAAKAAKAEAMSNTGNADKKAKAKAEAEAKKVCGCGCCGRGGECMGAWDQGQQLRWCVHTQGGCAYCVSTLQPIVQQQGDAAEKLVAAAQPRHTRSHTHAPLQ